MLSTLVTKHIDMDSSKFEKLSSELFALIQEEKANLDVERNRLLQEKESLHKEMEMMSKIKPKDGDVITLNVGGKKITTRRSTLCQVEGSMLAAMFSGRWEDRLERDEKGNIFLDFNPNLFIPIVNYLRDMRIENPEKPAKKPQIREEDRESFNALVAYLGLENQFGSQTQTISGIQDSPVKKGQPNWHWDPAKKGSAITLDSTRKIATLNSTYSWYMVLADQALLDGMEFQAKIQTICTIDQNYYGMAFGVAPRSISNLEGGSAIMG